MALQVKRCTEEIRKNSEVVLENGQPLYTTDTHKLFIGDDNTFAKDLVGTEIGLNIENGSSLGSLQSISSDAEAPNTASNVDAVSIGKGCYAINKRAVAIGNQCGSYANTAFTIGQVNKNWGSGTFVFGSTNIVGTPSYDGETPAAVNDAGSQYSIVGGLRNEHRGQQSITVGEQNIVDSSAGIGITNSTIVTGRFNNVDNTTSSAILGEYNNVDSHHNVFLLGQGLVSSRSNQALFGKYNAVKDTTLFAVGSGTSDANRKNAFEIDNEGNATILGTTTILTTPTASFHVARLKELDETEKDIKKDISNLIFGNDSYQNSIVTADSNTTTARYSAIFGLNNQNKWQYTIIAGSGNTNNSDTNSESAAIFGYGNINSGGSSIIAGLANTNTGAFSAVFGKNNTNNVDNALVCGSFSTTNTDSLFVVGNGTSSSSPSDAFKVKTDGSAIFKGEITSPTVTHITSDVQFLNNRIEAEENARSEADAQLQSSITSLNSTKANKATTLSGYGITDGYTKSEVDSKDATTLSSAKSYTDNIMDGLEGTYESNSTYRTVDTITQTNGKIKVSYKDIDLPKRRISDLYVYGTTEGNSSDAKQVIRLWNPEPFDIYILVATTYVNSLTSNEIEKISHKVFTLTDVTTLTDVGGTSVQYIKGEDKLEIIGKPGAGINTDGFVSVHTRLKLIIL